MKWTVIILILFALVLVSILYVLTTPAISTYKSQVPNQTQLSNQTNWTTAPRPLNSQQFTSELTKLTNIMEQYGATNALVYVADKIQTNSSFERSCHPLLHQLGHVAYRFYGSVAAAIKYETGICYSGYTHGILEEYLSTSNDINQSLLSACNDTAPIFTQGQCYHGLGHGAMLSDNESINQSLKLCRILPSAFATYSCSNGVFMQHFIIIDHLGDIPEVNPTNLSDCFNVNASYKEECYGYAPMAYLTMTNNYTWALNWCHGAQTSYIVDCIKGVGGDAMQYDINTPEVSLNVCQQAGNTTYQNACVSGAVYMYAYFKASSADAESLCQTVFVAYENTCEATAKSINQTFSI